MKTYDGTWKELQEFGFNILTGEACNISMRMLVDLNESAADLFTSFTGGCTPTRENYNSGSVKSCFITHSMVKDLLVFCLLSKNEEMIIQEMIVKDDYKQFNRQSSYLYCYENWQEVEEYRERMKVHFSYEFGRTWTCSSNPSRGLSNVHGFTGRSQ